MITKKQFTDLIYSLEESSKCLDNLSDMGVDIYGMTPIDTLYRLETAYFNLIFDKDGADTIYWWLYEAEDRTKIWDENGNAIPMKTVDDLWNFCKDYLKNVD